MKSPCQTRQAQPQEVHGAEVTGPTGIRISIALINGKCCPLFSPRAVNMWNEDNNPYSSFDRRDSHQASEQTGTQSLTQHNLLGIGGEGNGSY